MFTFYVEDSLTNSFSLFIQKLSKTDKYIFSKYSVKQLSEIKSKLKEKEEMAVIKDTFSFVCSELLAKYNMTKSQLFPIFNLNSPVWQKNGIYEFFININCNDDKLLFELLFNHDYLEYIEKIDDKHFYLKFLVAELIQIKNIGKYRLKISYSRKNRVTSFKHKESGGFDEKNDDERIISKVSRIDLDLYMILQEIQTILEKRHQLVINLKSIYNCILDSVIVTPYDSDFIQFIDDLATKIQTTYRQ